MVAEANAGIPGFAARDRGEPPAGDGGDQGSADHGKTGVGATAKELRERGLAQALAAALWESEPAAVGSPPPLPMHVPSLMDDADLGYTEPSREELDAMAAFDIPVATSVMHKAKRVGRTEAEVAPAWVTERLDEMLRLQQRHQDHVEKLYAENRVLRGGELAHALAPMLLGLTKLYDQMSMLTETDGPTSSAALLQTQLLQVLDNAASVAPFAAEPGSKFDTSRQRGVSAVDTADRSLDGRVSSTVRPGFIHHDGTVVRVAEVEVLRFRAEKTPEPRESAGA